MPLPLLFFIFLAGDLVAVFSTILLLRFVFQKTVSVHPAAIILISAGLLCNAFLCTNVVREETATLSELTDLLSFALQTCAAYAFLKDRKQWKTLLTVFFCDATTDMLYSLCTAFLPDAYWVKSVVCAAFYAAFGALILCAAKTSRINVLPAVFAGIPKWIWAVLFLFELTCYYKEFGEAAAWYQILYRISAVAVVASILYLIAKTVFLLFRQTQILEQLERQKQFSAELKNGDEELRRFRHDYKNHMIVVNALLSDGKTAEAQQYLAALNGSITPVLRGISTGNYTADALLDYKIGMLEKEGISVDFSGRIPAEGVRDEDVCTILSNLVDNAAEAVVGSEAAEREIRITAGVTQDGVFFLKVINPVGEKQRTPKKDGKNHGWGLKNVRRVVLSYDGALTAEQRDDIFVAELAMNCRDVP